MNFALDIVAESRLLYAGKYCAKYAIARHSPTSIKHIGVP